MMTAKQLKASILQMAMQGKLVPQDSNDEPASELLKKITAEKEKLIAEGKIKKEKTLAPISDDEIPFDIPSSWEWVRLNDIVIKTIKRGKSPKYAPHSSTLVFAQKCNTKAGEIDLSLCLYLDESKLPNYGDEEFIRDGDIVINSTGNGTLGRVNIYHDKDNPQAMPIVPDSHVTVIRSNTLVDRAYVFYALKYYQPYMESLGSGSTNQTELSASVVKNMLFPIPPLAEQKRIVAKIEELMPYVDQYAVASSRLTTLNTSFPDQMKKSILQQAVQGKLVPHDPNDEPASELLKKITAEKERLIAEGKIKREKKLAPINENEIPFDIPENWEWAYIGDIFQHNTGKALNGSNRDGNVLKYITTSNLYWNRFELDKLKEMPFTDSELDKCTVKKGDLLVCEGGDYGRSAIWNFDYDMRIQNHIHRLRPYSEVDIKYFFYIFYFYKNAGLIHGKGIGIKGLSSNVLHNLIVPVPPLAEQKRIVARIEELMPYCDELKDKQEKA